MTRSPVEVCDTGVPLLRFLGLPMICPGLRMTFGGQRKIDLDTQRSTFVFGGVVQRRPDRRSLPDWPSHMEPIPWRSRTSHS